MRITVDMERWIHHGERGLVYGESVSKEKENSTIGSSPVEVLISGWSRVKAQQVIVSFASS